MLIAFPGQKRPKSFIVHCIFLPLKSKEVSFEAALAASNMQ